MNRIYFKSNGGEKGSWDKPVVGWLAVGDGGIHEDGTRLLSPDCVTAREIENAAAYLKKLIDRAVVAAKSKLP